MNGEEKTIQNIDQEDSTLSSILNAAIRLLPTKCSAFYAHARGR